MMCKEQFGPQPVADLAVQFHKQYHQQLLLYARGLCIKFKKDKTLSHDLVQNFYAKVLRSPTIVLKGYKKSKLKYLMKMIKNDLLNINTKQEGQKRVEKLYCLYLPQKTAKDAALEEYQFIEIKEIMSEQLTQIEYELMESYLDGYKTKEIAIMHHLNSRTVGVKIHRAKKKLRDFFQIRSA